MKIVVLVAFLAIIASLGSALFFMLRGGSAGEDQAARKKRMARALAFRIGLSVLLFLGIILAWSLGWIQPTGLPSAR